MKVIRSNEMKLFFLFLLVVTLFFPLNFINGINPLNSDIELNWYESHWPYRAEIAVTSIHGSALVNYPTKIQLTSDFDYSLAQTNGEDIRFTDASDLVLPHWIELWNEFGNSIIWVKIPEIPPASTSTIYMYYGNTSVSLTSSGGAVFNFFEDFEGQVFGEEPAGWYIKQREWGNFTINADAIIGDSCCYFIDDSFSGSCRFYKQFSEDIVGKTLEYWIKPELLSSSGILCYNDDNDSYIGGSTYFGYPTTSKISYNDGAYHTLYYPYQADNWYFISVQLESTSSYNQIIYDSNGTLLFASNGLSYLGSPTEITYFMNGGDTFGEPQFLIDAIRYREYVSDEPTVEIIDYLQNIPSGAIPIFSNTVELFTVVIISFVGVLYIYKKSKKE